MQFLRPALQGSFPTPAASPSYLTLWNCNLTLHNTTNLFEGRPVEIGKDLEKVNQRKEKKKYLSQVV